MNRTEIYETLKHQYNDSEFKDLCFSLQVDYDNLSGSSKSDKMRELVMLFERRERLPELIAILSPKTAAPVQQAAPATSDYLQQAIEKVRKGELEEALQIMFAHAPAGSALEKSLTHFSSRFHLYRNNTISNLLSRQESDQQYSLLTSSLLELIHQAH